MNFRGGVYFHLNHYGLIIRTPRDYKIYRYNIIIKATEKKQ